MAPPEQKSTFMAISFHDGSGYRGFDFPVVVCGFHWSLRIRRVPFTVLGSLVNGNTYFVLLLLQVMIVC